MSVRTAVVLAAGEGTRLRPLTRNRPKPMLPAADRPILEHVLDSLVEANIERLVLVVGYRRERVQEHFGPTYRGMTIEYVGQEKQLGSGHALLQARQVVEGPVAVVNGDQLIESDAVSSVVEAFERESAPAVMGIIEREDAGNYGAVRLHDRDVAEIVEKPGTDEFRLMNAGIYAFDDGIFRAIEETPRTGGELALTDTLARLVDTRRVRGVRVSGLWIDATYPWDLLEVAAEVLARGRVRISKRREGVWVGRNARVHGDATLRPPVVVGPGCEVGAGTVVGPDVALGENVTVGSNVTLERAVVETDSRVSHGTTLLDAVLGQRTRVNAGVTVPGGPGDVRVDQRVFENRRLGAVLADGVRVGGAATFEPGTLVGPGATVGTGTYVRGEVPADAEVRR